MRESNHCQAAAVVAAAAPALSFLLQYSLSVRIGQDELFWHHATVVYLDWIFVPFNYFVIGVVDWQRGARLCLVWCVSLVLNVIAHAQWQFSGVDSGHMITASAVLLPAGWVHLAFATFETVLILAFVFCRDSGASTSLLTVLVACYFIGVPICSYRIHRRLLTADLLVALTGLVAVSGRQIIGGLQQRQSHGKTTAVGNR